MSYLYPRLVVNDESNEKNENTSKEYKKVSITCTNDNTRIITFITDHAHTHTIQHGFNPELNHTKKLKRSVSHDKNCTVTKKTRNEEVIL